MKYHSIIAHLTASHLSCFLQVFFTNDLFLNYLCLFYSDVDIFVFAFHQDALTWFWIYTLTHALTSKDKYFIAHPNNLSFCHSYIQSVWILVKSSIFYVGKWTVRTVNYRSVMSKELKKYCWFCGNRNLSDCYKKKKGLIWLFLKCPSIPIITY